MDNFSEQDWELLGQIRGGFLEAKAGLGDYWGSDRALELYEETFAQRIGWKWQAVVEELCQRGWSPPQGVRLLDWGCGTGIAARVFSEQWGDKVVDVTFLDRSPRAVRFATGIYQNRFANIPVVVKTSGAPTGPTIMLISHVANELGEKDLQRLLEDVRQCHTVIWVEAGSRVNSQRLRQVREHLRGCGRIIAPCDHQNACGLGDPSREKDWCHFFAATPNHVHQSAGWRRFAKELNVDLRSLPVSFLVMGMGAASGDEPPEVCDVARVLGRVREFKGYCTFLACGADGVRSERMMKRQDKTTFKQLCDGGFCLRYDRAVTGG